MVKQSYLVAFLPPVLLGGQQKSPALCERGMGSVYDCVGFHCGVMSFHRFGDKPLDVVVRDIIDFVFVVDG